MSLKSGAALARRQRVGRRPKVFGDTWDHLEPSQWCAVYVSALPEARRPDGHPKLLHLWPPKLPRQDGQIMGFGVVVCDGGSKLKPQKFPTACIKPCKFPGTSPVTGSGSPQWDGRSHLSGIV